MFERKTRTAEEARLLEAGRRLLPAGVRTTSRSSAQAMVIREARGSHITDVSGNRYIDYMLGSGPMILGHAHPAVAAAVREQLERGTSYLMVSEPAVRLAEAVVAAVPCAEKACFHGSGSESTFFALRMARAFTGRDKILKFEGAFHGMSDYAAMSNQWTRTPASWPTAVANSAGIPSAVADTVLVAPFNDIETTTAIVDAHAGEIAAVIVEPMQRTIVPAPGFLADLRALTERHGIVLVFDEVVTGFRLAYGGAQEYYGVVPDLAAVGKTVSGGLPISLVCGRADILDLTDPARAASGPHVMQTGTFSGNPLSCAAGLAALGELGRGGVYEGLFAKGRRLMDALQRLLDDAGIPAQVLGEPPAFEVWFAAEPIRDFRSSLRADTDLHGRFTELLVERGIVKAHEKFFVSTAHDEQDIETTVAAFESAIVVLADERPARRR